MLENIIGVCTSIKDRDFPYLEFKGGSKHPLTIIIYPCIVLEIIIVYTVFMIMAIIIDFCNLFVWERGS